MTLKDQITADLATQIKSVAPIDPYANKTHRRNCKCSDCSIQWDADTLREREESGLPRLMTSINPAIKHH